jgi:hypothetical protein
LYERQITLSYVDGDNIVKQEQMPQNANSGTPGEYTSATFAVDNHYKPGEKLAYWALDRVDGLKYNPNDPLMISEDKTLYAVWQAITVPEVLKSVTGRQPLNVFTTNDKFEFDIIPQNPTKNDFQADWKITDYDGKTVASEKTTVPGEPNLVPNGDCELPMPPFPLMDCTNGISEFAPETDLTNVRDGNGALRVTQKNAGAHAGYQIELERDCDYEFEYDIKILSAADGGILTGTNGDLSEVWVGTNFMFSDANASAGRHHIVRAVYCPVGDWTTVKGTLTPSPEDPNAGLEDAWFAIYPHVSQAVAYVVDNVKVIKKAKGTVSLEPQDPGHYVVEVWTPDEKISANFAVVAPYEQRPQHTNSEFSSPFGVSSYFSWYNTNGANSPYTFGLDDSRMLLDDYARALKLSGITWVREMASWNRMELNEKKGKDSQFAFYINAYANNNLKVLETISDIPKPSWINGLKPEEKALLTPAAKNAMTPENEALGNKLPDNLDIAYESGLSYGNYYKGKVNMWEVFNEPDGGLGSGDYEAPDKYAAFLKAMSIGFHDAGVPVSIAGLVQRDPSVYRNGEMITAVGLWRIYQDTLFKNGIMNYAEVYNFHNHQYNVDPAQENESVRADYYNLDVDDNYTFSVNDNLAHLANKNSSEVGGIETPAWVTEAGGGIANSPYGLDDDYNKQKIQARYLVTSAAMSLSTGVDKHFWFSGREELSNRQLYYTNVYWSSFNQFDPSIGRITPYAAYAAQAAMTKALGEAKYLGELKNGAGSDLPAGTKGYAFNDGSNNTVLVLWAENDNTAASLNLGKPNGIRTNIMGKEETVPSTNGVFELSLGQDPIYLKVTGTISAEKYKDTTSGHTPMNYKLKTFTPDQKIVLDQTFVDPNCRQEARFHGQGYTIRGANVQTEVTVTIYNFNQDVSITGTVTGSFEDNNFSIIGESTRQVDVPAGRNVTLTYTVKAPGSSGVTYLSFTGNFDVGNSTPSVSKVRCIIN